MRAAVIDIGSSSIKLIIGEHSGKKTTILESLKNMVPLGHYTFYKEPISQQTINQTIQILENYKKVLREYKVTRIKTIATTAIREAKNKTIFLDTITRKTKLDIDVLNVGDVVFYLDSYLSRELLGAYPLHEKNVLIAELGAGSLDFSVIQKGYTLMNIGLPVGTLRIKQLNGKLNGSDSETHDAIREYIENEFFYLKETIKKQSVDDIILVDENYSSLLKDLLDKKQSKTRFFALKKKNIERELSELAQMNSEQIIRKHKVPPEMADLISGYAIIVNSLFLLGEKGHLYIFETTLAEAILSNILKGSAYSRKYNKTYQLISAAKFLCKKFGVDYAHTRYVANLSRTLFKQLHQHLGLKPASELYLILAAYLHDIGMFIHNRAHHKHTEYIINSLNLFRLTDEEIKIIGCIARYHRKSPPLKTHFNYMSLPPDKQLIVQKLSALLRIANALDRSHKQKSKKFDINSTEQGDIILTVFSNENYLLERTSLMDKKRLFEQITGNKINLVVKNET